MKKLLLLSQCLLTITLLFPLSGFSQVLLEEEIESRIEEAARNIEVIHVSPDDPLLELLSEESAVCNESNPVFEPNTDVKNLFKHLLRDTGDILLAPIGWKKEDWMKAGFVVAGLAILSTQDSNIQDLSQSLRSSTTDAIAFPLEKIGNGGPMLAILGSTYATSLIIKDQKLKNTTLTAIEGLAVAAVLTTIGKKVFHRQRPNSADDQYNFSGPGLGSSNMSFPSGHTGTAFAVATVFAEAYKDKKLIPIIAYTAAGLAGLSRINDNKHWFTDVLGGATLGYLAGKFVSNRRLDKNDSEKVKITPSFSFGKEGGMNVSVTIPIGTKKRKG